MEHAREFIEGIARKKGSFTESLRQQADEDAREGRRGMLQAIQAAEEIREQLSNALNIISTNLYTSRARFLMEVIQNADDAQYLASSTPTLCITITPELVAIECNETGFTEANVESLCRTGQSSKPPGQGYTGEKGIGFKSVFKIAKRAHIRSPPYYFELDRARMLGMITPRWDEEYFANHSQEYQTTIILDQICDNSTNFAAALERDIESIHPMVILFLRRIERLQMTLSPSVSQNGARISRRFRRYTTDALRSGITTLENEDSGTKEHFYKIQYTAVCNGTEERRPNVFQTDIVLAFPVELVSNTWTPKTMQLNTYAYLPLGNFGFKFIVQADFLTTANRQSVEEDNPWNINIARAIPEAFVNAVATFNRIFPSTAESARLSKTWPMFLEGTSNGPSQYWSNIHQNILRCLKRYDIIQTRSGSYAPPQSLMFLSWAKDRNDQPIFDSNNYYVSSAYPASVHGILEHLGVRTPDSMWVSRKLQDEQRIGSLHFRNRSSAWYSDLAKVILTPNEYTRHTTYISELRKLSLIPLVDGRWSVAPTPSSPIYFPQSLGARIPSGLPLTLVEEEACECNHRKELFALLGVKNCDASNIAKEIVDYHTRFTRANRSDVVGHAKYLYRAKDQLMGNDLVKIYFAVTDGYLFFTGSKLYTDSPPSTELAELFSGHEDAHFLHPDYFQDLHAMERTQFIYWLKSAADVATVPRLTTQSGNLHDDFRWILENKNDRALDIIRRHWDVYSSQVTSQIQRQLADCNFLCQAGNLVPLRQSFIPLPSLVQNGREFCGSDACSFLVLSGGLPSDWGFLSRFEVGIEDNLDFYLWILDQPGFKANPSVERAKKLYCEIQSRAGSSSEKAKVRNAFSKNVIALLDGTFVSAENCVYHAPRGFRAKPALFAIYGDDLSNLFQNILCIRFASGTEAIEYLHLVRSNVFSTMEDVSRVYEYLQRFCEAIAIDPRSRIIAMPSSLGPLEWKKSSECVWDDSEFSQNELQLRSKIAMQQIIKQHAPAAELFFTTFIKLPNAGIDELLGDLELLQEDGGEDSTSIFRLYERIEVYRRSSTEKIKEAFKTKPLVFFRGYNGRRGRWLKLNDCVWSRTILRSKYALMSTLNQYRSLFRDTLDVRDVTLNMLVQEFISISDVLSDDNITYSEGLLLDMSRERETNNELRPLRGRKCWPCRLPRGEAAFCAIGDFYVNDRQNLFDIFKESQTFLDLDFDDSRKVTDLLRKLGCVSFLSERVRVNTEAHEPLHIDFGASQNYQRRADALNRYFEHYECSSTFRLVSLLESAKVWISPNIETHYHLASGSSPQVFTVTRVEGGSCIQVNNTSSDTGPVLEIYLSSDRKKRNCALVTDFPKQLLKALKVQPFNAAAELHQYLEVPLESLNMLLVRNGIIGEIPTSSNTSESDDTSEAEATHDEDQGQSRALVAPLATPGLPSGVTRSVIPVTERSRPSSVATGDLVSAIDTTFRSPFSPSNFPTSPEEPEEAPPTEPFTTAGIYNTSNRIRNTDRLRRFAQNSRNGLNSLTNYRATATATPIVAAFDLTQLGSALEDSQTPILSDPLVSAWSARRSRAGLIPDRNQEDRVRHAEIGFLGEYYMFTVLHDQLRLPNFSGAVHWTSSLRSRAGFNNFDDGPPDFTYQDAEGALTRCLQQMHFPYTKPTWLDTVLSDGNKPTYLLEVKSTPSRDPKTHFFMSGHQHDMAKDWQVTSTRPTKIYVIVRISGLDALEYGANHEPQWRVYLDPYTLGEQGVLDFYAPKYTVTAVS